MHYDKDTNNVNVTFELPGLQKEDVSIDLHNDVLTSPAPVPRPGTIARTLWTYDAACALGQNGSSQAQEALHQWTTTLSHRQTTPHAHGAARADTGVSALAYAHIGKRV